MPHEEKLSLVGILRFRAGVPGCAGWAMLATYTPTTYPKLCCNSLPQLEPGIICKIVLQSSFAIA
eukprot:scaffold100473_cov21-Tisochrysis_lutea.AAC.1